MSFNRQAICRLRSIQISVDEGAGRGRGEEAGGQSGRRQRRIRKPLGGHMPKLNAPQCCLVVTTFLCL